VAAAAASVAPDLEVIFMDVSSKRSLKVHHPLAAIRADRLHPGIDTR